MIDGMIIKGIGGFYYVKTVDMVYECKARGKFRKEKIIPMVGDRVKISVNPLSKQGAIEEILKRDTMLIRPPVANVEQAIIVFAIQQPDPNLSLLDRFLVLAESQHIDISICFNKVDLNDKYISSEYKKLYESIGYSVIMTSTKASIGIEDLKTSLKDTVTVFAGPSGVGKSSLLNYVQPDLHLKMGEISQKIDRGKHTTRHVELLELQFGGWVVDTPGFSSLNLDFIQEEDLQHYFREFNNFIGQCRFNGCKHLNEPDCAIKHALSQNVISESRYISYSQLIEEIRQARRY